MKSLLFWIVPPLAGAFIGYITNLIAIWMLFRPLKETRVFGFRLPFTPGVLPRERGKFADSIGRMVENELLTPGVLRERLAKTEVRDKIETAVGSYTGQMLQRPLSYWLEDNPGEIPFAELLKGFVNSDVFDSFLEELLRSWLTGKSRSNSRLVDFGSLFIPAARGLIKKGITREIKNHSNGGLSNYRLALVSVIEKYPGITLGEFLSLGKTNKRQLDFFLAEKTTVTLDDNIEEALSSVNVRVLVSDRINSLDMLRVEKIIIDVMAGQLKWINLFGGIVGAIIGFVQAVLSFIMRTQI
jgi:uncharacterized membrane protein YheB (UPF0754 family)